MGKFCGKCGTPLRDTAKFCPNCGQRVKAVKEERSLVERVKNNDTEAWEELYKKTYPKAYAVAIQTLKNKEDAMDVLQEAYVSVFKKIDTLKDESKLGAWVNQIVANRCIDYIRKYHNDKSAIPFAEMNPEDSDVEFEDILENDNQEFMPEESVDYNATKKIMQEILDQLSEEQRLCVLMYYYEELSVSEIAEALGCSTGTIKSRLNYARKYIKNEVETLEKKGTKLYSIAPLPFLVWMLRSQENTVQAKAAEREVWQVIQNKVGITKLAKNAKKSVNHVQQSDSQGIRQKISRKPSQRTVKNNRKATTRKISGKAAGEVAKKGTKGVATKIVAGVVAVTLVGAGVGMGYMKQHKITPRREEVLEDIADKKESKNDLEALYDLYDKVDFDYIACLISYFPYFESADQLTDDELTGIYYEVFEEKYLKKDNESDEYTHTDREVISDDQIVSENGYNWNFKKSALNQFMQISGISKAPEDLDLSSMISADEEGYMVNYQYAGERGVSTFKTQIVSQQIDENNYEIVVGIEKNEIPGWAYSDDEGSKTQGTITIIPADNDYGYKIKSYKNGYPRIAKNVQLIEEDILSNRDKLLEEAKILGDYTYKKEDEDSIIEKISYEAALQCIRGKGALITNSDKVQKTDYLNNISYYDPEKAVEVCELAGVTKDEMQYERIETDNFTFDRVASQYEIKSDGKGNESYPSEEAYFLRTEVNEKKKQVKVYYLSRDDEEDGTVDNFKRGIITVEPKANSWGYAITSIKTEEWNDEYSVKMKQIEEEANKLSDYGDSAVASEIMQAVAQGEKYWVDQMGELVVEAENKYPEYKNEIEKAQEEYWRGVEEEVNEILNDPDQDGNSMMSPSRVNSGGVELEGAVKRSYFIVGNLLIDDKIETIQ